MDEVLLKRLLGALVLLGFAFLVATVLPGPEPSVPGAGAVAAYDLRTGAPIRVTPVPEAEPAAPTQVTEADPEATPAPPKPAAAPAPSAAPAASPAVPAGPRPALKVDESLETPPVAADWYVQVGSYSSQANARGVLQKLFGMGMPTVIQSVSVGKNLWYRVRVGPYAGETSARKALATVRKEYPTAKLVHLDSGTAPKGN